MGAWKCLLACIKRTTCCLCQPNHNDMMKTEGSSLYYSSLPNDGPKSKSDKVEALPTKRKDAQPSPSPRKTVESASSSISNAVVTSVNSARKIKDRARSFVPKKLACTPGISRKGLLRDEVTPVIYYQDEDTVVKRAGQGALTYIDPFSFGDTESPGEENASDGNSTSPTSVIPVRLFPDDALSAIAASPDAVAKEGGEKNDFFDEVVTFDCPVFTSQKFNEEDTSIDVSEAIKSINAVSIVEEAKAFRESIRAKREAVGESLEVWQEPLLSWDGFTRSSSFNICEWDPKSDNIEAVQEESANK